MSSNERPSSPKALNLYAQVEVFAFKDDQGNVMPDVWIRYTPQNISVQTKAELVKALQNHFAATCLKEYQSSNP